MLLLILVWVFPHQATVITKTQDVVTCSAAISSKQSGTWEFALNTCVAMCFIAAMEGLKQTGVFFATVISISK